MAKRKPDEFDEDIRPAKYIAKDDVKKHSLDSDEEDEVDDKNVLDEEDIEGEEEGISGHSDGVRMTAFNMREEMEEGHFDKQGHFIWKKEEEIRDNWLDNIDWQKIKTGVALSKDSSLKGLGEDSDSEEEKFDEIQTYKELLKYMKPKETVNRTLRRLGGDIQKLSSAERLKRKKAGTLNTNKDVEKVTELANKILSEMGNMDVYQETYEQISQKVESAEKKEKPQLPVEPELDMYADDFGAKEKEKLDEAGPSKPPAESNGKEKSKELSWEFKWSQETDEIQGPFTTEQMHKWHNEGYFKSGVMVRKCGTTPFYTSNRIDFDLYM